MKYLLIIFSMVCLFSCRHSDPQGITKGLQKLQWHVSGYLSKDELKFSQADNKDNQQAVFLSNGRLFWSTFIPPGEPQFDAHGYEVVPGTVHIDSCYTYEVKNDIIKISSHGHGTVDEPYYYKLIPEKEPDFVLKMVSEKDFK